jgi:hypothetical protein
MIVNNKTTTAILLVAINFLSLDIKDKFVLGQSFSRSLFYWSDAGGISEKPVAKWSLSGGVLVL